ncbi:3350_t:CDS:2, partial [Rhizophagus irregularis]
TVRERGVPTVVSAFYIMFSETEDIQQFCVFGKTIEDLMEEVGEELARKMLTVRDTNPEVWTSTLESYIDTVLDGMKKISKIRSRTNYQTLKMNYIAKKFSSISQVVRVDVKGTRISDGFDIFHIEVAGPPCDATYDGRFLVTELATAVMPFSFNSRCQYKSVLKLMAIFHKLMEVIIRLVLRSKETTVRHKVTASQFIFNAFMIFTDDIRYVTEILCCFALPTHPWRSSGRWMMLEVRRGDFMSVIKKVSSSTQTCLPSRRPVKGRKTSLAIKVDFLFVKHFFGTERSQKFLGNSN